MHQWLNLGDKTAARYREQTVPFSRDNPFQFRLSPTAFSTPHKAFRFSEVPAGVQRLGQELQSGSLSAAQSDFASLKSLGAQSSTTTSQNNSPIAQAFNQLAKDLQSGNLSAAQQDFKTIQQDFENQSAPGQTQASQSQPSSWRRMQ